MKCSKEALLLYAVTDRSWLSGSTLYGQIEESLKGGVTFVQLREKTMDEKEMLEEAVQIKELCARYNTPFVINDRVDIALKSGADGVHLGQKDMFPKEARRILGSDKIIGVSARTVEQALQAQSQGADYLGVGAAFSTSTKKDACRIDQAVYRAITEAVDIPVIAIGGITQENVTKLSGNGLSGIAVVSALFAQKNIKEAAMKLKKLAQEMVTQ